MGFRRCVRPGRDQAHYGYDDDDDLWPTTVFRHGNYHRFNPGVYQIMYEWRCDIWNNFQSELREWTCLQIVVFPWGSCWLRWTCWLGWEFCPRQPYSVRALSLLGYTLSHPHTDYIHGPVQIKSGTKIILTETTETETETETEALELVSANSSKSKSESYHKIQFIPAINFIVRFPQYKSVEKQVWDSPRNCGETKQFRRSNFAIVCFRIDQSLRRRKETV